MLERKLWDLEEFDKVNLPEVIGTVTESVAKFNGIRVLDMPIFMPGQGWKIPAELNQFLELISLAVRSENRYGNFTDDHYVYITVDQKEVTEGKTGRRPGAHSDAYIESSGEQLDVTVENKDVVANEEGEVSHTYIFYDNTPTEFFNSKFPLIDASCDGSLATFDEIADKSEVITYDPYTLLRMDPYVVHRCSIVEKTQPRTFVKISISKKKYARVGNTRNEEFEYNWETTPRSEIERNHPWI